MVDKLKLFLSFLVLTLCFSLIGTGVQAADAGAKKVYTPETVMASIYMITAYQDKEPQWTGTGWMVGPARMVTAGHVCDTSGEDGFTFRATNRWNQEYPIKVIKFSRDPDLCLIDATNVPTGMGLSNLIAHAQYGEKLWYSGAPVGVFGDGTVPFAQGYYIGGYKVMIAGYPGASGSPIYNERGVVGVLVAGFRGTHLIVMEPAWALYEFLKED